MSLELKYTSSVTIDGLKLLFQETTGIYQATTNPTGWGTPNIDTTDSILAKLEIIFPNETEDEFINRIINMVHSEFDSYVIKITQNC